MTLKYLFLPISVLCLLFPFTGNSQHVDGTIDTTFNIGQGSNGVIFSLSLQSDGKIIVGGWFSSYDGNGRNLIVRLNEDGSLDSTFNPPQLGVSVDDFVQTTLVLPNGKIFVGGNFTRLNGLQDNGLKRLNPDGSLDTSYHGNVSGSIACIKQQADGKIIASGLCSKYSGTTARYIFRLNSDDSIDSTFNTMTSGSNAAITSMAIQADGKIIIGGGFSIYKWVTRYAIARLNTDASLDTTFHSGLGVNNPILENSLYLQSNGKAVFTGHFTSYDGITVNGLARLNSDGSLDISFNEGGIGMNAYMPNLTVLPNDKIMIGGSQSFTTYNGIPVKHIIRLNADGTLDTNFNPLTGQNSSVTCFLQLNNQKMILGGNFTSYDSIPYNRICRIYSNNSVGIDEENEESLSVFPNPANTTLRITNSGDFATITDLTGKTLLTVPTKHKEAEINISTFANGIYFLKTNNGQTSKLIIQY